MTNEPDGAVVLRGFFSATVFCVVGGLLGGLALGYVLSRQGAWLTPVPWAVYLVALLAAIGIVTWLDERRRLRTLEAAWPLPAGFMLPEVPEQAAPATAAPAVPETGAVVEAEC